MVYRFKVTYEDHEDVFRHIEIKSSQSFLELHNSIQQAIGFDNSKPATFYISDDYWRKEEQISVENAGDEKIKRNKITKSEEHKKKKTVADYIDNPHQRFVYVFDPEKEWTFLLELLKIIPEDKIATYPQCIKSVGTAPKQYKQTKPPPPAEDDEDLKKSLTTLAIEKEEHTPLALEKDPLDEDAEGFIPIDEDGIEELTSEENKEPGEEENEADVETSGDAGEIDLEGEEPLE